MLIRIRTARLSVRVVLNFASRDGDAEVANNLPPRRKVAQLVIVGIAALLVLCTSAQARIIVRIPIDAAASEIKEINGRTWVASSTGAYRLDADRPRRIPDEQMMVNSIESVDGKVWLATEKGAYQIDGDMATLKTEDSLQVLAIRQINGRVWLGASSGLYRSNGGAFEKVIDEEIVVTKIEGFDGEIWQSYYLRPGI